MPSTPSRGGSCARLRAAGCAASSSAASMARTSVAARVVAAILPCTCESRGGAPLERSFFKHMGSSCEVVLSEGVVCGGRAGALLPSLPVSPL